MFYDLITLVNYNLSSFSDCHYAVQLLDSEIDRVIKTNSSDLITHNREHFSMVHPQTFHNNILSPLGQWQCGCQFGKFLAGRVICNNHLSKILEMAVIGQVKLKSR